MLDLAVQNTNLKALKLSFTPAEEALERMRAALDTLVDERAPSADAAAIVKEAYRTQLAAVEIHTLEGRHIAEARDEEMDKIEARMKGLDEQVRQGFIRLTAATGESGVAAIDAARAAYADFQKVNAEVISLSRRNSNVRSLAISLGQKRKVTVECQERLSALQDAIRSERFRATR